MCIYASVFHGNENMNECPRCLQWRQGRHGDVTLSYAVFDMKKQFALCHLIKYHNCILSLEAQLSEKISLQAIQQLVRKSYQALALWKLLCEHQFTVIVGELQKVR